MGRTAPDLGYALIPRRVDTRWPDPIDRARAVDVHDQPRWAEDHRRGRGRAAWFDAHNAYLAHLRRQRENPWEPDPPRAHPADPFSIDLSVITEVHRGPNGDLVHPGARPPLHDDWGRTRRWSDSSEPDGTVTVTLRIRRR